MIVLGLDGVPTPVASFTACAALGPAVETSDVYRLEVLHLDGRRERQWVRAVGVQDYQRIGRVSC